METFVVVLVLGGIGLIAFLVWYFSETQRFRRLLRKTPRVAIRDLQEGEPVRIVGTVQPLEEVEAPISGRPCAYYEVVVEEKVGGKHKYWRQRARETSGVAFAVDDGTGAAYVDPSAARVVLSFDHSTRSGTFDDANERETSFLARHGVSPTGWIFNKALRYKEGVLEAGETIAVLGVPARMASGDASSSPFHVRMIGTLDGPLLLCDYADTTAD